MKSVLSLVLPLTYFACGLTAAHHASRPHAPEGFVPMFDGKTMSGWYADPAGPQTVWNIDEKSGEIRRSLKHGYLWSEQSYGNFILELEYKLSKGCNSGVFVRTDPGNPVQGGFEIQLRDSEGKDWGKNDHGAIYDSVVPSSKPAGKVGEWDKLRILVKGDIIRVWINGTKVSEADLSKWTTPKMNPDGTKNKFKTALNDLPKTGHIGFQDHGHNVSFRNIFIKEL
jgi:hypothetical protein